MKEIKLWTGFNWHKTRFSGDKLDYKCKIPEKTCKFLSVFKDNPEPWS
jgi:hypothetical protein